MVYVDPMYANGWVLRGWEVKNCHLIADTDEELHAFAEKLGMKRTWFQGGKTSHYDLTQRRRDEAVRLGAVELTRRELALWIKAQRGTK